MFNATAAQRLNGALGSGTNFRWTGTPRQGLLFRPTDVFAIPFSLMWCGFSIFWETTVLSSPAPLIFEFWGVPFVLVGLFFVAGRFILDGYLRAHTTYAVGDDAVYIVRDGILPRSITLFSNALSSIEIQRRPVGSGTVLFAPREIASSMFYGLRMWGLGLPPAFEGIPKVEDVYRLIEAIAVR